MPGRRAGRQSHVTQEPDVVFLDVEIPGKNGLELLNSLPRDSQPSLVVVTAFDRYAVRAFEVEALDYLLKPFNKARFAQTINRLRPRAASLSLADLRALSEARLQEKSGGEIQRRGRVR